MSEQQAFPADTLVDVLRHGEVAGGAVLRGVQDDPLTPLGRKQMLEAVGKLRDWDVVVTSPLSRCHDVAEVLAKEAGARLVVEPGFAEMNLGDWEGLSLEALFLQFPEEAEAFMLNPFAHQPPEAEEPEAFQSRVLQAWEALGRDFAGKRVLLVTHGGPLRVIVGAVLGMTRDALVRIETPHACLSRIRVPQGEWKASLVFHAGRL